MTILPKAMYQFNSTLIELPMAFFRKLEQLKKICTETQIGKAIFRKKNGAGGIRLPDFRLLQNYSNQNSMLLA